MDSILKKSLSAAVAAQLRDRLESGAMKGILPGVRRLSQVLGVSVPTVCRALHQLEAEGVLVGGGKRRRWRAREDRPTSGLENQPESEGVARKANGRRQHSGRLLFLSSHPLSHERHSGVEVFAELLDQLGTTGWEVRYRVENFWTAKKPRKSWDELLKLTKPDAVVILGGTPVIGEWMKEKGMRTLFIGGDPGKSGVPVVAVKVSTMLHQALERLIAIGHRRILIPLCGRARRFVQRCQETAIMVENDAGLKKSSIVIAETPYARPEVIVDLLRRQWQKQAPDAIILLDWREFLAASGFFRKAGVEIPRDLSVVLLSQNASMDWHLPAIAHFEHPVKLVARTAARWVIEGRAGSDKDPVREVRARWMEGQSVMERK